MIRMASLRSFVVKKIIQPCKFSPARCQWCFWKVSCVSQPVAITKVTMNAPKWSSAKRSIESTVHQQYEAKLGNLSLTVSTYAEYSTILALMQPAMMMIHE